jgi:hypothetical protein
MYHRVFWRLNPPKTLCGIIDSVACKARLDAGSKWPLTESGARAILEVYYLPLPYWQQLGEIERSPAANCRLCGNNFPIREILRTCRTTMVSLHRHENRAFVMRRSSSSTQHTASSEHCSLPTFPHCCPPSRCTLYAIENRPESMEPPPTQQHAACTRALSNQVHLPGYQSTSSLWLPR